MESNHFNFFRIKNFKRFNDLKINDIGQFNLILGDNNVGKTSLLEALLYPNSPDVEWFVAYLYQCLQFRIFPNSKKEFWRYFLPTENYYDTGEGHMLFEYRCSDNVKKWIELSTDRTYIHPNNYKTNVKSKSQKDDPLIDDIINGSVENHSVDSYLIRNEIPFIPFQGSFSDEIADFYLKFMQGNKELKRRYVNALHQLFSDIEDIEPSFLDDGQKTLLISRSNSNYSVPLAFYGEGTIKLTKILSHIIKYSGKQILVDEIDTGIYHSRMKDFWKVLLEISLENKTQFFATTHNLECIKAYQQALQESGQDVQNKSRTIRLVEHSQTEEIIAFTNSYEKMEEELTVGNELR